MNNEIIQHLKDTILLLGGNRDLLSILDTINDVNKTDDIIAKLQAHNFDLYNETMNRIDQLSLEEVQIIR